MIAMVRSKPASRFTMWGPRRLFIQHVPKRPLRDLEHFLCEFVAIHVRTLQRGVTGVMLIGRVVVADAATRLHRRGGDAVDNEMMFDDMVGFGEGSADKLVQAVETAKAK